ncbi:MAG: SDR family oxidoreductase [Chloroflexi bacterium]|uniref:SDR family oxidoreductase n=1 Tax=Candidatus Chlorohelix allophototropha TaxID=3003348 RepID=A0A8T7M554_9CHLR|nr:SDR family oxidoreductase [Chloroflexota bacterium]WJW69168.1 SDR family oxidoreductase [Chloroflexota bacterium L227-S17]
MANYDGLVLVAGATGGVGRRVVRALVNEGIKTRVLVRDNKKGEILAKLGVEVFIIDVANPQTTAETFAKAVKGVTAIISALGTRQMFSNSNGLKQVDYFGNKRLIDAARAEGVKHYILNSTMGVHQDRSLLHPFSIPFYPKWQAEEYLVKSGLPYTIIRPGGLVDSDEELKLPSGAKRRPVLAESRLSGDDGFNILGRVHREDVALTMVRSLWTSQMQSHIYDLLDYSSVKPNKREKIVKELLAS